MTALPRFEGDLDVRKTDQLRHGRRVWILLSTITLRCVIDGSERVFTAPKGIRTDFASVPRLFWRVLHPSACPGAASVHDHHYRERLHEAELGKRKARHLADRAFREGMKAEGIG